MALLGDATIVNVDTDAVRLGFSVLQQTPPVMVVLAIVKRTMQQSAPSVAPMHSMAATRDDSKRLEADEELLMYCRDVLSPLVSIVIEYAFAFGAVPFYVDASRISNGLPVLVVPPPTAVSFYMDRSNNGTMIPALCARFAGKLDGGTGIGTQYVDDDEESPLCMHVLSDAYMPNATTGALNAPLCGLAEHLATYDLGIAGLRQRMRVDATQPIFLERSAASIRDEQQRSVVRNASDRAITTDSIERLHYRQQLERNHAEWTAQMQLDAFAEAVQRDGAFVSDAAKRNAPRGAGANLAYHLMSHAHGGLHGGVHDDVSSLRVYRLPDTHTLVQHGQQQAAQLSADELYTNVLRVAADIMSVPFECVAGFDPRRSRKRSLTVVNNVAVQHSDAMNLCGRALAPLRAMLDGFFTRAMLAVITAAENLVDTPDGDDGPRLNPRGFALSPLRVTDGQRHIAMLCNSGRMARFFVSHTLAYSGAQMRQLREDVERARAASTDASEQIAALQTATNVLVGSLGDPGGQSAPALAGEASAGAQDGAEGQRDDDDGSDSDEELELDIAAIVAAEARTATLARLKSYAEYNINIAMPMLVSEDHLQMLLARGMLAPDQEVLLRSARYGIPASVLSPPGTYPPMGADGVTVDSPAADADRGGDDADKNDKGSDDSDSDEEYSGGGDHDGDRPEKPKRKRRRGAS